MIERHHTFDLLHLPKTKIYKNNKALGLQNMPQTLKINTYL